MSGTNGGEVCRLHEETGERSKCIRQGYHSSGVGEERCTAKVGLRSFQSSSR